MARSATSSAAFAALSLLSATSSKSVQAQQALTPAQIAPDIAITEAVAHRPLSAQERAEITAIDQAQFRREPAWSPKALRQAATSLENVHHMDPVRLADWRKQNIVSIYFSAGDPHITPSENKAYLAIYTRTNPIVVADTTSKTVVCERDIDAWVSASQMLAQKSRVPVVGDLRAELTDYARNMTWRGQPRIIAANMERDWAAYQLGWVHEPLSDQRGLMKDMNKDIHAGVPQPSLPPLGNTRSIAICALTVAHFVYGDYPYCLSPKFAAEKAPMALAIMQAGRRKWEALHALNGYVSSNP